MSQPKKRKSDVHIDVCAHENADYSQSKKEKHWFGENQPNSENRRSSFFGLFKKMKSSSTLKTSSKTSSSSKMESVANETQHSINSESSVTSTESTLIPNVAKNAGLRTFVNRDSCTPVPPQDSEEISDAFPMPTVGGSKEESAAKMEDSLSVSSQMSVDTIGSNHMNDEDLSIGSASAFCTPSRNPINRNPLRMSTRSVPDWDDGNGELTLFRSLCNSAVRSRQKPSDGGPSTPMRRSMRMSIQKRNLTAKSMEDVPEEEALTVSNSSIRLSAPIEEEEEDEKFGYGAKEFFAANLTNPLDESADEGKTSMSRLSTSSEARKSSGSSSIGRKNSIFRKMFPGNKQQRRMSEASEYYNDSAPPSEVRGRRASIVSFTNDCSFAPPENSVNPSASVSSLASNDSMQQPKMRKKAPSTSNLSTVFRLSSVFRKSSNSTYKDEDSAAQANRRSTLTGFSSISSGIGSISSGFSDSGYSNFATKSGHSISRSGSKRDEENKRDRCRRLLERVIISDIPADELLKLKLEQLKKKEQKEANERFETQLNESGSSTSSQNELLNFDVVAVDLTPDGSPFSSTASGFIDEGMGKLVRAELPWNTRPDRCGSITECDPEMVYVCQEQPQCAQQRALNESMCSANSDLNSDFLRNVRSGLCNAIEVWKKMSASRDSSTMLIYPMFCQSEAEWDSKATIDAIFLMLDGILLSEKRWRANGKCILAGITANNVRLLRERYEEVKQAVAMSDVEPASSFEELDTQSITSNSTVFGARL